MQMYASVVRVQTVGRYILRLTSLVLRALFKNFLSRRLALIWILETFFSPGNQFFLLFLPVFSRSWTAATGQRFFKFILPTIFPTRWR